MPGRTQIVLKRPQSNPLPDQMQAVTIMFTMYL